MGYIKKLPTAPSFLAAFCLRDTTVFINTIRMFIVLCMFAIFLSPYVQLSGWRLPPSSTSTRAHRTLVVPRNPTPHQQVYTQMFLRLHRT